MSTPIPPLAGLPSATQTSLARVARPAGGGTIPLQDAAVYGPIHSRRFGNSLGINVLPVSRKVCSSNCVYCQYGWTSPASGEERLKRAPELLAEIRQGFERHVRAQTQVDCVTLAGNGEPTLHPELIELVIGIKGLRDTYFPKAAVGVLSDATQVMRPRVRQALALLDLRCMKFDAADEATWKRVNDPLGRVDFQAMLEGLRTLPNVVLQSMFIRGSVENVSEAHIGAWIEKARWLAPLAVQVYTIDRPTAADGIQKVPRPQLQQIADRLTTATGIPTEVFE